MTICTFTTLNVVEDIGCDVSIYIYIYIYIYIDIRKYFLSNLYIYNIKCCTRYWM